MSSAERRLIVDWLLAQSNKGALEYGDIKACAERFGTNRISVARIWKRYKDEEYIILLLTSQTIKESSHIKYLFCP